MNLKSKVKTSLCVVLALNMAYLPLWGYAAEPESASATPPQVDLTYVPPTAVAAAVAYPRTALTSPSMEMMPIEVVSAAGLKEFGIDPVDIENVLIVVIPPGEAAPGFGAVLRLARAYSINDLTEPLLKGTEATDWNGKPYRKPLHPDVPGFFMPDDRTLMIGQEHVLHLMVANHANPAKGPLGNLMDRTKSEGDLMVVAVMDPIRPMVAGAMAETPLPPPFTGLKNVPDLVAAAKLDVGVTSAGKLSLTILAIDDQAASQLENLLNAVLDLGRQVALMQLAEQAKSEDPVEQATARYSQRISGKLVELLRPKRDGRKVWISIDGQDNPSTQIATMGILIALLLPAVQSARAAARRVSSSNNMKQIGLAMHLYHDTQRHLPARAVFDENGKPLLSWRVLLLPYLENNALFEEFHLDEPWDSEHNRQLIERMPAVYQSPNSAAEPGKTVYLAPVGEGTLFEGREGKHFADVKDGTSNTIAVLEVDDSIAVVWTKPDDWPYNPDQPFAGLGHVQPHGFNALFCDGSVHFITNTLDLEVFKRLLTIADGEQVPFFH